MKKTKTILLILCAIHLTLGTILMYKDLPNYSSYITNHVVCLVGFLVLDAIEKK